MYVHESNSYDMSVLPPYPPCPCSDSSSVCPSACSPGPGSRAPGTSPPPRATQAQRTWPRPPFTRTNRSQPYRGNLTTTVFNWTESKIQENQYWWYTTGYFLMYKCVQIICICCSLVYPHLHTRARVSFTCHHLRRTQALLISYHLFTKPLCNVHR